MYQLAILTLFPAAMIFAAFYDLFSMTIPNRISIALVASFCLVAPFSGLGAADIGLHVLAGLTMLAVTFVLFAYNFVGGGDAKLAAAAALWFGFGGLLDYALVASMLGGLLTIVFLGFRMLSFPPVLAHAAWVERLHNPKNGVPYGIALAAAGLIVYHNSFWMRSISG